MNNELLKEINATVITETADALDYCSKTYGMSIGEIIDRLVLNTSINDPDTASTLVCEYMGMVIRNQNDEQVTATLFGVAEFCLKLILRSEQYTVEDIVDVINKTSDTI